VIVASLRLTQYSHTPELIWELLPAGEGRKSCRVWQVRQRRWKCSSRLNGLTLRKHCR